MTNIGMYFYIYNSEQRLTSACEVHGLLLVENVNGFECLISADCNLINHLNSMQG